MHWFRNFVRKVFKGFDGGNKKGSKMKKKLKTRQVTASHSKPCPDKNFELSFVIYTNSNINTKTGGFVVTKTKKKKLII